MKSTKLKIVAIVLTLASFMVTGFSFNRAIELREPADPSDVFWRPMPGEAFDYRGGTDWTKPELALWDTAQASGVVWASKPSLRNRCISIDGTYGFGIRFTDRDNVSCLVILGTFHQPANGHKAYFVKQMAFCESGTSTPYVVDRDDLRTKEMRQEYLNHRDELIVALKEHRIPRAM